MSHQWRVTKYDPGLRDRRGVYRPDEWTSCNDVGTTFDGIELTLADYLAVEDRYVSAVLTFLNGAELDELVVKGFEHGVVSKSMVDLGLDRIRMESERLLDEQRIIRRDLSRVIRLCLRNVIWCKLEADDQFFVHFGYDYYMYVGSSVDLPDAIIQVESSGLFVEEFESPYISKRLNHR